MSDRLERMRLNQAVIEIGMLIFSKHSLDEVVPSSLGSFVKALGADAGQIALFTDGEWLVRYECGFGPEVRGARLSAAEAPIATRVQELCEPVVVEDCCGTQFDTRFVSAHGLRAALAVPILMRQGKAGCLYAWTRSSPRKFSPDEVTFARQIAAEVALALENAQLLTSERQAREEAEATEHNLQLELSHTHLLLRASDELLTTSDPDEVLRRLAGIVLDATGMSRVFINLIDVRNRVLTPKVAIGRLAAPAGGEIPFERLSETSRKAIELGRPTVMDFERPDAPESDRATAAANQARVALFVPLVYQGTIIGHIAVDEPGERYEFSSDQIRIVASIAAQAATALQNAQAAALRAVELLEDQLRWLAFSLHDGPAQTISAAGIMLAQTGRNTELDAVRAQVAAAAGLLDHASFEMRDIMRELRPAELEAASIVDKIGEYIREFERQWSIPLELSVVGNELSVCNHVQVCMFRVVQEALTNVRRHARAHHVDVEIRFGSSEVECLVRDDGRGFDIDLAKSLDPVSHMGLTGMRARMLMIGGDLEIASAAGEGSVIRAYVPLDVARGSS